MPWIPNTETDQDDNYWIKIADYNLKYLSFSNQHKMPWSMIDKVDISQTGKTNAILVEKLSF